MSESIRLPHHHISHSINLALVLSRMEGGFYLPDLAPNHLLEVETANRIYVLMRLRDGAIAMWGHPRYCPRPVLVKISGSTLGWVDVEARIYWSRDAHGVSTSQLFPTNHHVDNPGSKGNSILVDRTKDSFSLAAIIESERLPELNVDPSSTTLRDSSTSLRCHRLRRRCLLLRIDGAGECEIRGIDILTAHDWLTIFGNVPRNLIAHDRVRICERGG